MATGIGNLVINLAANTAQFRRGMKGAQAVTGRFSSSMRRMAMRMAKYTAATAAAGAATLAYVVKRELTAIDTTVKLSRQLGVTADDLLKLRRAAKLTGAGADSLDAGLKTMAKRLGESARAGTGPAAAALKDLGLNIQEIAAKNPADAFREIAGAMDKVHGASARNAIAANLFSKANSKLLLTLSAGKTGLKEMGDRLEYLGGLYGENSTRAVEQAADVVNDMRQAFHAFATEVTLQLAPFIAVAGREFAKWIVDTRNGLNDLVAATGDFNKEFGVLGGTLLNVIGIFSEAEANKLADRVRKLREAAASRPVDALGGDGASAFGDLDPGELDAKWQREIDRFGISKRMNDILDVQANFADDPWGMESVVGPLRKLDTELTRLEETAKRRTFAQGIFDQFRDPLERAREEAEKIAGTMREFPSIVKRGVGGRAIADAMLGGLSDATKKISDPVKRLQEQIRLFKNLPAEFFSTSNLPQGVSESILRDLQRQLDEARKRPLSTGPRFAPGDQLGSAAAYHNILRATSGSRIQNKIEDAVRKSAAANERTAHAVEVIAGQEGQEVGIPVGGGVV